MAAQPLGRVGREASKSKRESKEFFYFEVFLETLLIESNITDKLECEYNLRSPIRGMIQVGSRTTAPVENYQSSRLVLGKHKKEHYEYSFNTGKCLLFSLPPSECLQMLLTSPLTVTFDTQDGDLRPPVWFSLCYAQCRIDSDLVRRCLLSCYVLASHQVNVICPVVNTDKGNVGTLSLVLSLTSMGETVVTEIQVLQPKTFLHSGQNTGCQGGKPKERNRKQIALLGKLFQSLVKETDVCEKTELGFGGGPSLIVRHTGAKVVKNFVQNRQAKVREAPRILSRLSADFLKKLIEPEEIAPL